MTATAKPAQRPVLFPSYANPHRWVWAWMIVPRKASRLAPRRKATGGAK